MVEAVALGAPSVLARVPPGGCSGWMGVVPSHPPRPPHRHQGTPPLSPPRLLPHRRGSGDAPRPPRERHQAVPASEHCCGGDRGMRRRQRRSGRRVDGEGDGHGCQQAPWLREHAGGTTRAPPPPAYGKRSEASNQKAKERRWGLEQARWRGSRPRHPVSGTHQAARSGRDKKQPHAPVAPPTRRVATTQNLCGTVPSHPPPPSAPLIRMDSPPPPLILSLS